MLGPAIAGDVPPGGVGALTLGAYDSIVRATLGANLVEWLLPDDATGGASITGITARIGNNATAGTVKFTPGTINGRVSLYTATGANALSVTIPSACAFIFAVAYATTLPFGGYRTVAQNDTSAFMTGAPGTSALYAAASVTHRVNNQLTTTVPASPCLLMSTLGTATTQLLIGSDGSGSYGWVGHIGAVGACTSEPSTQELADLFAITRAFNRF